MPTPLSTLTGQQFNETYAKRPVWALASSVALANSPMVATYGASNPYVPLNVEYPGNAKTKARSFPDEQTQASPWVGSTSAVSATLAYKPSTGSFGIAQFSQTGCLVNFEVYDSGNFGNYNAALAGADALACRSGPIVGEQNWRQTYDLALSNGRLYKEPIGGGLAQATSGNRPSISMNTDLGPAFVNGGAARWGLGQVSHNRNTGHMLVAQPLAGTNGVSLTFRLHFFDLRNKISEGTTIAQLKQWMKDATVGAPPSGEAKRYRYADVVFASPTCHWAAGVDTDAVNAQFVLCDNDEVWMFKSCDSASTSAQAPNCLFRVNIVGGDFLLGTYAATALPHYANSTTYGPATSPMYGAKHMNSDDNSVIAMYQHAYYYQGGCNIAFVSTKNASATSYNHASTGGTDTTYSIAPCGGPNFVLCNSSANNDNSGPMMAFAYNEVLSAAAINLAPTGYLWPSVSSSTLYGGNMVLKVQPTTEWK